MNVVYVMEKGASGGAHQAGVISEHVDVDLVRSKPLDYPDDVTVEGEYVEGDRGIKYPVNSLAETVRALDPDVTVFHILDQASFDSVVEVSTFSPVVLRVGLNPFEIGMVKKDMPEVVLKYLPVFDHIITASEAAKHRIMGCGVDRRRITVIPTAIDMSSEHVQEPKRDTTMNIGTLGRLGHIKNHQTVIYSLNILQDMERSITPVYHIAGAGEEAGMLDDIAAGLKIAPTQVGFYGYIDDIEGYFDNLAVHVHPSLTENFPQSVLEAARAGVPTITSKAAWTWELDSLMLVDHDDPYEWARAIRDVLTNDAERYKLAKLQQEEVRDKFDIRDHADTYRELFEALDDDLSEWKIPSEVKA